MTRECASQIYKELTIKSIKQALREEASLAATLDAFKQEIYRLVHDAGSMEGVTPIQTSFPCAKISISFLAKNLVLSPGYYLSQKQAEVVQRKLSGANTIADFVVRIRDMSEKGMPKRICVYRAGYAIVPGETNEEAFEAAQKLTKEDFDWEPVQNILGSAEIVEDLGPAGEILTMQECSPPSLPQSENCDNMPYMDNALAGGYILLPTYAVLKDNDEAMLKETDETPVMYFAIQKGSFLRYLRVENENDAEAAMAHWLGEFTYDESQILYEFGLSEGAVAFSWCEYLDAPFHAINIADQNAIAATVDLLSGKLQENGYTEASKYLDVMFNL